jgi:4a-hydroxytetrahydrobiopterin dehydratase
MWPSVHVIRSPSVSFLISIGCIVAAVVIAGGILYTSHFTTPNGGLRGRLSTALRHQTARDTVVGSGGARPPTSRSPGGQTMGRLSEAEIQARLGQLPGWQVTEGVLRKLFTFSAFSEGIRFVDRVAELADAADHHPDIDIRYTKVVMSLMTHSAGAITEKDFALASQIDQAAST